MSVSQRTSKSMAYICRRRARSNSSLMNACLGFRVARSVAGPARKLWIPLACSRRQEARARKRIFNQLQRRPLKVPRSVPRRLGVRCRRVHADRATASLAAQVVLRSSEHHLEHHLSVTAGPPESRPWMDFSILVTRCHGRKRRSSSCQGGRRGFDSRCSPRLLGCRLLGSGPRRPQRVTICT
jgi:hypothetical protein